VRTAGRLVDNETEEAYEILDDIISHHYVMLNRAPTLHRLSIQSFQPVLIEGKAIQLHPMVCAAFNADFDGDQMAVHVPLTDKAREESANIMLSSKNLIKPASGEPITTPSLDLVLGIYYLTHIKPGAKGEGKIFAGTDEAILAYQSNAIAINAEIHLLFKGKVYKTSVGRAMFNDILPEDMQFVNHEMTKKELKDTVSRMLETAGQEETAAFIDRVKNLGFKNVTLSGISWGMDDLVVPSEKAQLIEDAKKKVAEVKESYNLGLLTNEERKNRAIEIWNKTKDDITDLVRASLDKEGPVYSMVYSKARGSESVVVQMTGMKGLMAGATGETLELPVRSSYKEGLDVLEYFISTHGARKGMADTALRTATAGYLTRRLVDVAQDVIVTEENCGDRVGGYVYREDSDRIGIIFASRVEGRTTAGAVKHPKTDEVIVESGVLIDKKQAQEIDKSGIDKVKIRTAISCKTLRGICQKCYGVDLGRRNLVALGQAVGTVAAQAIGEPGTQLTMRTFHVGGVAGSDITQGLPRVEEIFEARTPKGESVISEIDGAVVAIEDDGGKMVTIVIEKDGKRKQQKKYSVPSNSTINVAAGDLVAKGTQLNEGHIDLKKLYETMGKEEVHRYIVREIQEIYAAQGEGINDKHVEIIVRQMFSRIRITEAGDTTLIPGEIVEMSEFNDANIESVEAKGKESEGEPMILGITKVALSTESFLSAASFQETARVLINAAITGKKDHLRGLKENVIIGRLIPAGTGFRHHQKK
jgi:DNA-directed RNA polymerase subunit beta'